MLGDKNQLEVSTGLNHYKAVLTEIVFKTARRVHILAVILTIT